MPKLKGLSIKRRKFVALKAQDVPNYKAYTQAGYKATTKHTAEVESTKLLKKPEIQEALAVELASQDINLHNSILPIAKGLKATKGYYDSQGNHIEAEDLDLQLKASDRALKLLGISGGQGNVTVFATQITIDKDKYKI